MNPTPQNRPVARPASMTLLALLIAVLPLTASEVFAQPNDKQPSPSKRRTSPQADNARSTSNSPRVRTVAHWRFQKGIAGNSAPSSQLIEDSSGNGRHGQAFGGPKYQAVELPTTSLALSFDGHDDRIFVADHRLFHLTKSFTIEAYIEIAFYPESAAEMSHIVFRGDNRLGFDPWFLSITQSGQLRFLIADSLNMASFVMSPAPLPTRKLIHVAAVLDHTTNTQSLFLDGKQVATTKTKIRAGGPLGGSGAGIGIGGRQAASNQGFRGTIAELRISAEPLAPFRFLPGTGHDANPSRNRD